MPDQELFDGEIKTVIEDDENLSFRKADPATPGSRVISWANFKAILNTLYVALTGNQVINGIKQFISSPTVPDPTTDLQAVNLRTLISKTNPFDFVDFTPQDPVPSFKRARVFFDDINDCYCVYVNGATFPAIRIGRSIYARVANNSGAQIDRGKVVKAVGLSGFTPSVELAKADNIDDINTTLGMVAEDIPDGQLGYVAIFEAVAGIDTSALLLNKTVYLSDDIGGGVTSTPPSPPNYVYPLGLASVIDLTNGVIGVRFGGVIVNDTDTNFKGGINGIVTQTPDINYDASSGDIIATVTNEAFPTKDLPFLIDGMRYLLDTTSAPATIIIPPGLSSAATQESILYIRLNAGVPELAVTTSSTISEPFAILSVQTVFNAIRTDFDGKPLSYRRYNNAMDSLAEGVTGAYGLINVITNWIRLRGASGWTSGQDPTPTVDDLNIKLAMTSGVGGQLHEANLPLFDGNNYLIYNDNTNAITYEPSINLTDITETSGGVTLLANNVYYPIKLFYLLNSNGVGNEVIATRPSGFYTTPAEAQSDALKYGTELADPETELNSYALYTMVIGRTGGGGATIALIELQNNRKRTLKGDGGGGAGVIGGTNDKVRATATDTTNSFLDDKLTVSPRLTKTIINPGANEQIDLDAVAHDYGIIYLDPPGGDDANDATENLPVELLQEAIDRHEAAAGDEIKLKNYSFTEVAEAEKSTTTTLVISGQKREYNTDASSRETTITNIKVSAGRVIFKDVKVQTLNIVQTGTTRVDIECIRSKIVNVSETINDKQYTSIELYDNSEIDPAGVIDTPISIEDGGKVQIGVLATLDSVTIGLNSALVCLLPAHANTIATLTIDRGKVAMLGGSVLAVVDFDHTGAEFVNRDQITVTGTQTDVTGEFSKQYREAIKVPLGARITNHTIGANKMGFHIDYDFFLETVTLEFDPIETGAGPTGSSFVVDINVAAIDGTSLATILSTKLSVDAGEFHSSTAATAAVISTNAIAQYDFISIDIDQIGSTLAGQGGFVTLNGYRT